MLEDQLKSARLLLVDDQTANLCLLQNILNRLGFTALRSVSDSRTVLEATLEFEPDLIVLDLHMPHVSGYEVLHQLGSALPRDVYLPVLVLTADATPDAKKRALAAGAADLLHKPFDTSEVFMRIRNLLRMRFLQANAQSHNLILEKTVAARTRELSEALTELKATQQQVLRHERLKAFSEMAGGVVHDFNNALMSIIGYSDLLLADPDSLADRGMVLEYLETMNTAGRDAAHVVSRLRDFYRPRDISDEIAPVDLNALLEQIVALTQPKWRDQAQAGGCTITLDLDLERLPSVQGNHAELRELVTNLVFNAVDAMPRGGRITLRSRRHAGENVIIEVCDTGTGMSEEVRARCLEPFFSTKGEKGTGLGLSMVFGIVKRHGGTLEIDSTPGRGTTFRIALPRGTAEAAEATRQAPKLGRALRVLVVDDEPVTRRVVSAYLQADGHKVVAVESGAEAVAEFDRGHFDLLLTDHAMPGMSGMQLAGFARERQGDMPVIVLTGFSKATLPRGEGVPEINVILNKPIPQNALRRAIAQAMAPAA